MSNIMTFFLKHPVCSYFVFARIDVVVMMLLLYFTVLGDLLLPTNVDLAFMLSCVEFWC